MKTLNKILAGGLIGLVSLIGCTRKPSDLNRIALKEYQETRQKLSDKEWKTIWSEDKKYKVVSYADKSYIYMFGMNADETECTNLSAYIGGYEQLKVKVDKLKENLDAHNKELAKLLKESEALEERIKAAKGE